MSEPESGREITEYFTREELFPGRTGRMVNGMMTLVPLSGSFGLRGMS